MTMPVLGERFRGRCATLAALGLITPATAGLAWWLAAMPASAQSNQPGAAGAPPPVPGTEGRRAVAVAVAAYRSAEEGRAVDL